MYLLRSCAIVLVLAFAFSACASDGTQPGTLAFIKANQQRELARACYNELTHQRPWKEVYYNIGGGVFVDEWDYCKITAWRALHGGSFPR